MTARDAEAAVREMPAPEMTVGAVSVIEDSG
jgi:hypothetical protein